MSREIKFRVWDKNGKPAQMYYDPFFSFPSKLRLSEAMKEISDDGWVWMQFTGLHDSAGTEIYESDIIESIESGLIIKINEIFPASRFPKYDWCEILGQRHGNEILRSNGIKEQFTDDWLSNPEYYKIIGNIHENPELLEGEG